MISFKELYDRKVWYLDGRIHRDDGPAIEYTNGDKAWYQNGKHHRLDGPAIEYSSGYKEWYQDGNHHRIDGPAIEKKNGDKWWYLHGKWHRIDGPAFESNDGTSYWSINGCELSPSQIKSHQIQRLFSITLVLSPLELPPYVVLWILEWSESEYISSLSPIAVVKMLEGIRNSRLLIKI